MPTKTVRIREETKIVLRELADRTGQPMQTILDLAVEEYRRQRFLQEANEAYAALRKKHKAWNAELSERKERDATMADGQENR